MVINGFRQRTGVDREQSRVTLDAEQRAVVGLPDDTSAAVIGAPGSGKTTTIVELVADRIIARGWDVEQVLVITPTRSTATRLRDILAGRVARPTSGPLARSAGSVAFGIATHAAAAAGALAPRLITGGEQDADFAQLLAGHAADGTGPGWPDPLDARVRALRGFRTELRELLARVTDHRIGLDRLRLLADAHGHQEWRAAADFFEEYAEVSGWLRPGQFDPSELVQVAVEAIRRGQLDAAVARLRLVVVDDLQEATESTLALLRAMAGRGIQVIGFGDPDVASNAFRGGQPDAVGRLGQILGIPDVRVLHLGTVHRHGTVLRRLVDDTVARIGAAGAGHQRAAPAAGARADHAGSMAGSASPVDALRRIEASTAARQWAAVARLIRERNLLEGVPLDDMCVVVRSSAQVPLVARSLSLAGVSTRTAAGGRPLREDRAARALISVVDAGMRRTPLTAELCTELLLGPFGGLDRLGVRRLRLALRAEEVAGGGRRSGDELLVDAFAAPGRLATIDHRVARSASRLVSTVSAVGELAGGGGSIDELLWLVWERSGLAKSWGDQALSTGIAALEADRNLDGVVALFTAAKRFSERRPDAPAAVFLDDVLDAEVPEDTLSPQSLEHSVLVTTPSGTVGLEFDTVVVAGLQEGIWPNRRLRGSLLAPDELVRIVSGVDSRTLDERKLVLDDELRMFALAVSRARSLAVLSAVANDDESRSVFFSLLPAGSQLIDSANAAPLSLRSITGRLRRRLVDPASDAAAREDAAATLAALALEEVPGADPGHWHGLPPQSTTGDLFDGQQVPISPSRLERFEESPLDWFIETIAGSQPTVAMSVGTIIHWAMETASDPTVDTIWSAVESRWNELLFDSPWLAEHQRRAAKVLVAGISEYLHDFERHGHGLVAAEKRFTVEIGDAVVNGSIDRIERTRDGRVIIVDLKTGTPISRQDKIDAHPQLGAYQLAYHAGQLDEFLRDFGEHAPGGAKLLYVKKGIDGKGYREGSQAPLDDDRLELFRDRIRQAAAGMAAAEFVGAVELNSFGLGNVPRLRLHRVPAVSGD